MLNDLRFAFRSLRRAPGFSAVAIMTLALGIGANTALFSVADAVLLERLVYPEPDRIVKIVGGPMRLTKQGFTVSPALTSSPMFTAAGIVAAGGLNLGGEPGAERVVAAAVSDGFFGALGTQPLIGRTFTSEESTANARVVVVGERLWKRRLAAHSSVGGAIELNGRTYTVIGVMPQRYAYPDGAEVWITAGADMQIAGGAFAPDVVARLAPGITSAHALQEVQRILGPRDPRRQPPEIIQLRDELVGSIRPLFGIMAVAVALVLLVACLNIANLLLARVSARERELAVRRSLGASRARIVRYLLCESAWVGLCAGALAIPVALWTVDGMRVLLPMGLHGADQIGIDLRAAGVTAALSLAATVLFGLAPSLATGDRTANDMLRAGASTSSPFWRRFRGVLVAGQLAAALILLAGSIMIVRTVSSLLAVDLGASGERALTMQVTLPYGRYGAVASLNDFQQRLDARVRALPGVEAVAMGGRIPGSRDTGSALPLEIESLPRVAAEPRHAVYIPASVDYFSALGIPLVAGRVFSASDRPGAPPVVIVSEEVARVHGVRPEQLIGQTFALYTGRDDKTAAEIVGVVRDVRLRGPESLAGAQLYVPYAQRPAFGNSYLIIKTTGDPRDLVFAARAAVGAVDGSLPPYNIRTFKEIRASYVAERRFAMLLMTAFAVLTGVLAAIGLYGVMTYLVQLRSREIGIRLALGATPGGVLRETMRGGLWYAVPGVVAGVVLAAVLSRLFISRIPGLLPADPATLGLSAAGMLGLAILSIWIPARAAGRIDPVDALRSE